MWALLASCQLCLWLANPVCVQECGGETSRQDEHEERETAQLWSVYGSPRVTHQHLFIYTYALGFSSHTPYGLQDLTEKCGYLHMAAAHDYSIYNTPVLGYVLLQDSLKGQ